MKKLNLVKTLQTLAFCLLTATAYGQKSNILPNLSADHAKQVLICDGNQDFKTPTSEHIANEKIGIEHALTTHSIQTKMVKSTRLIDHLKMGSKQTVVAFGTSLTAVGAWVDQLRTVFNQQFPGQVNLINGAQGGANSDWGVKNLDEKVLKHRPDCVFIEFSINDAVGSRRTTVGRARKNLNNMIDRILVKNQSCEIILMVMNTPVGHTRTRRPNLATFENNYREVAQERGFQLIDHGKAWNTFLRKNPGRFLFCVPDTVHPVRLGGLSVSTPTMVKALGLQPGKPEKSDDQPCFDYLFRMMDVNKNKAVTRDEFDNYWIDSFSKSDSDGNEVLDLKEFWSEELVSGLDDNKDGKVSYSEYSASFSKHFTKRDKNSDGSLVQGEIWQK
jgi:lysophospholipase L1-like esterase